MRKLPVGTLIEDNGKIGVVTKVIEMGTLNMANDIIKWRANYEVHYADSMVSIIACSTIERLLDEGKIVIISYPTTPLPHYPTASFHACEHTPKHPDDEEGRTKCGLTDRRETKE
jgi:hypothetical protein